MPIVNKLGVTPEKHELVMLTKAGELRRPEDFTQVSLHIKNNCKHLIVHDQSCYDEVVLEVHDEMSEDGTHTMKECRMESFALNPQQRYELAIYLLSTIRV